MAWIHTGISCMAQKHFVYGSPEHNRNEENLTINELTGANFIIEGISKTSRSG